MADSQDFQAIINEAVTASVEKALSRMLSQRPSDSSSALPSSDRMDRESLVGSGALSGEDLSSIKRHWKGSAPLSKSVAGKAPMKRPRLTGLDDTLPAPVHSSDDEDFSGPGLDVVDEWQADSPASADAAHWDSNPAEESPYVKESFVDTAGGPSGSQAAAGTMEDLLCDSKGVPLFDPRFLRHPKSSEWNLPDHLARYVNYWIRKPLEREARNRLRAECPRPSLPDKVALTPEFDPTVSTFMARSGRDPRKGLERGLKTAQDKLLDVLGPLSKILYFTDLSMSEGSPVQAEALREWAQRSICLLGNANVALSTERRKAALLRIDAKLSELGSKDLGPAAQGLLFGEPFIMELKRHVNLFTTLNKAQTSLKQVFRPPTTRGVFGRAGRQRGRAASRFWSSGPRANPPSASFFPSSQYRTTSFQRGAERTRGPRGRGRGRFNSGECLHYKSLSHTNCGQALSFLSEL
ncbi:uncharacterized protein WCC33_000689 [Rhinophrynus dorsalis]